MDMSKYRGMFLSESKDHLKNMGRLLLELEGGHAGREGLDALFRDAHSVKGMAASMGYVHTAELAHHLEDSLDDLRRGGELPAGGVDRLLAGVDLLEGLVEDIEAGRPEREVASFMAAVPSPAAEPAPSGEKGGAPLPSGGRRVTIRLLPGAPAPAARALLVLREVRRFARVLSAHPDEEALCRGGAVEALTVSLSTELAPGELKSRILRLTDVAQVVLEGPAGREKGAAYRARREDLARSVRVHTELLDRFIDLTGELITSRYMVQNAVQERDWGELRLRLDRQDRLISDLHHQVLQVRMMPLESITGRLPRLIRDLARRTGKEVSLTMEGEGVQLDRSILEGLSDPLVHLVRNAVDHGIEKSGTVTVRAWREKDFVTVEVSDDGRGMDPEAIRRKALEQGVITPAQAKVMAESDLFALVCIPGFSTASQITETSGRGVGMDVVKSVVEGMGGSLGIASEPGRGTRFALRLPLSVAIVHLLVVECGGHRIGIPFTRVQRALELERDEIRHAGRRTTISLAGEEIPLISLRKVLHLAGRQPSGKVPVVVADLNGRLVGLVPDRLAGQRQAFIKGLTFPLDRLHGMTGTTVLGDGSVLFIFDPQALLDSPASRSLCPKGESPCTSAT